MGALLIALAGLALAGKEKTFWLPKQSSTIAAEIDWVWGFIFWLSAIFFVIIVGLTILFAIQYRARPGYATARKHSSHNMTLELTWTIIPSLLIIPIFWFGFKAYLDMTVPPANSYEIGVTAQRWAWMFTYPNGYVDENLHVPVDRPVKLVMQSEDVIHSFFVPNFRVKRDIVPGRYNIAWFEATEAGEHVIFCTEYCGTGHSDMLSKVVVHPAGEFEPWLEDASNFLDKLAPAEAGAMLYNMRGCKQCHTVDGTIRIGPSFKGAWGAEHALSDGSKVTVEENYVRQSILDPASQVVAGYDAVMPTYKGRLKDQEITAIIAYIKSLQ